MDLIVLAAGVARVPTLCVLERHGYVERVPDPGDRRAKLVRATARGRELYAVAREVVAEIEDEWTARLGERKMRRLRGLLEELNDSLAEVEGPEAGGSSRERAR